MALKNNVIDVVPYDYDDFKEKQRRNDYLKNESRISIVRISYALSVKRPIITNHNCTHENCTQHGYRT